MVECTSFKIVVGMSQAMVVGGPVVTTHYQDWCVIFAGIIFTIISCLGSFSNKLFWHTIFSFFLTLLYIYVYTSFI